jgi:TRAP-type C4-dicarboxylate transport system permease small subunit
LKVLKFLDENFEKYLLVVILTAMCILIGLQVFFRYFVNLPLAWTEEISRYLFVWLIYLASSLAVKKRRHLKVDAVLLLFKAKGQYILKIISNFLFLLFCVFISYYAYKITYTLQFIRYQESPAVGIPMSLAYASVFVGLVLMIIRLIQDTILLIKERDKELNKEVSREKIICGTEQ